jgi:hypothetical protein
VDKTTARSPLFRWASGWASCGAIALVAVSATALSARAHIVGVPDAIFVIPEVVTLVALPSARARWWRPFGVLVVAMTAASVFAAPMALTATTWYLHMSWIGDRAARSPNRARPKNSRVSAH